MTETTGTTAAADRATRRKSGAQQKTRKPEACATPGASRKPQKGDQPAKPERETKAATIARMLRAPEGTGIEALCAATGWQSHSVRASLSGLRKAGFGIASERGGPNGATIYRITAEPEAGA